MARSAHTYSIVARDPETGQLGVAVQSHYFSVGGIVTWAEPGVGAVATQSFAEVTYGPLGLGLMRAGKPAQEALTSLLASDSRASVRQVGMVDARGGVAAHTGALCIQMAGHHTGTDYSAQANLMLSDTVWDAMADAFERTRGDLGERLMTALEAAENEGGDIRGKQSAALLVVEGSAGDPPWSGRLFDLRVEDHPTPLKELRRLMTMQRAYHLEDVAETMITGQAVDDTTMEEAARLFHEAADLLASVSDNPEPAFWYAVALAAAGRVDAARPLFQRVFAHDPNWRALVPRLTQSGQLPEDPALVKAITEIE